MKYTLEDFNYELPKELIAKHPLKKRSTSKLLCFNKKNKQLQNMVFTDILSLLNPKDLLILNDTRVMKARLLGKKSTGGKVEIFIERILSNDIALAHVKSSKRMQVDQTIYIKDIRIKVIAREENNGLYHVKLELINSNSNKKNKYNLDHSLTFIEVLSIYGEVALPPYLQRIPDEADESRYQTVYANNLGSTAAPTAGLHFDEELLNKISEKNINTAKITLHVGTGTFQPVRTQNILEHKMHSEYIEVSDEICKQIIDTKKNNGKVVAVGTTCVRALESAASQGLIKPYCGETSIFITPGYKFNVVDAMITNFHLPCSTLLMLVCAFAGYENTMNAYFFAIKNNYRFYSYGDAMYIY